MGPTQQPVELEWNPIYGRLVDYPLIEKVYHQIQMLDDPRLDGGKTKLVPIYRQIADRWSSNALRAERQNGLSDWRGLPTDQLVAFSQQVFDDICGFVTAAMDCYRALRAIRPLTGEEREQGQSLKMLVQSVQALIIDPRTLPTQSD
jgi:hypothetical protein